MVDRIEITQPYTDLRVLDLYGVNAKLLNNRDRFSQRIQRVVDRLDLDLRGKLQIHQFEPDAGIAEGNGSSAVGILGKSHLASHGWPEHSWPQPLPFKTGYLRFNFEFCSQDPELHKLDRVVLAEFMPREMLAAYTLSTEGTVPYLERRYRLLEPAIDRRYSVYETARESLTEAQQSQIRDLTGLEVTHHQIQRLDYQIVTF